MATYTPNLSLYMPDSTDDFGEFREEHNDNMVKIDNAIGGGGGSGGHTIVNPSGSDMPAEGKLQFTGGVTVTDDSVNGKTVVDISGGGGNVYGAFIDTNRLITSGQYSSGSPLSYTATEDCFVYGVCTLTNNTSGSVSIDGVQVGGWYNGGGTTAYNFGFLVKNGQTITASQTFSGNSDYKVYGLTQGTSGIFTPIIYSDTERVVGVWRDNKPLYQKSYTASITAGTQWIDTGLDSGDLIVRSEGTLEQNNGQILTLASGDTGAGAGINTFVVGVVTPSKWSCLFRTNNNDARGNLTLTLYYTKGSDSAGSGNWNTDGVPTVHYSTSEQVIGTWTNNKPLYQRTYSLTGGIVIGSYGHISLPADSIVRGFDGYAYRNSHASVDKFNGFINSGDLYVSIRSGQIEYWISNIFNPVEEIEFTVQYTKVTD